MPEESVREEVETFPSKAHSTDSRMEGKFDSQGFRAKAKKETAPQKGHHFMKLKTDEKTLKALHVRAIETLKAALPSDAEQHAWSMVEYTTLYLRMPNGDRVNFQYAKNLKETQNEPIPR